MKDSDDLELQVNADEMCRTCLGQFAPNQLKPIFCNEILDGKIVPFPQVLESAMGIKPVKNEVFPKNVCINCKTKLKELYSFKEKTSKSIDLLYEIFGLEKPPPQIFTPSVKATTTVGAGTQTNEMIIREEDFELYSRFLQIERTPKPATNNSACQAEPTLEHSSSQTEPIVKLTRNASAQVDPPAEPLIEPPAVKVFKNASVQVDQSAQQPTIDEPPVEVLEDVTTVQTIQPTEQATVEHSISVEVEMSPHAEELLEEVRIEDDDGDNEEEQYTHMDVIEDIEEIDDVASGQEENIEDYQLTEITEQEDLKLEDKPSKNKSSVKLEPLSEHDLENESIEYLTYEVVNEPETEVETESESCKFLPKKEAYEKHCNYCQLRTNRDPVFDEHNAIHQQTIETIFDGVDYFRCSICKLVYVTSSALEEHLNLRTCAPVNPENFVESNDTLKHEQFYGNGVDICLPRMQSFFMNEESHVICSTCGLAFETVSGAWDHSSCTQQHEDQNKDVAETWVENGYNQIHTCGICHEQFTDASFIRQHVYFHRSKYECPFDCKDWFRDFYKLTVHLSRYHLTAVANSSSNARKTTLPSNMVCQICFKRFSSKASLKIHSRNHFADRRYTCTLCPKAFLQKSDLTIHIRSHTDERPYSCTIPGCDKKFRTSSHRRDHMSTHAEQKNFQCPICQKYFKAERILQGHIRLHSGLKPFDCLECGKTFSRKHHVKLHMKTHVQGLHENLKTEETSNLSK